MSHHLNRDVFYLCVKFLNRILFFFKEEFGNTFNFILIFDGLCKMPVPISLTFSAPADKYVEWKFGDNQGKLKQYYRRNKTEKEKTLILIRFTT